MRLTLNVCHIKMEKVKTLIGNTNNSCNTLIGTFPLFSQKVSLEQVSKNYEGKVVVFGEKQSITQVHLTAGDGLGLIPRFIHGNIGRHFFKILLQAGYDSQFCPSSQSYTCELYMQYSQTPFFLKSWFRRGMNPIFAHLHRIIHAIQLNTF